MSKVIRAYMIKGVIFLYEIDLQTGKRKSLGIKNTKEVA